MIAPASDDPVRRSFPQIVDRYDDVLSVPVHTVLRVGNQPTVYVLGKENQIERRPVELGLDKNTLFLFFSDNGANGAHATAYPGNADGKYLSSFDNRLENRGLKNSFIDMGPSWAQASTAPFRLFKALPRKEGSSHR